MGESCVVALKFQMPFERSVSRRIPSLGFGIFYGQVTAEAVAGDFALKVVTGPPPPLVLRHTHESAHFCLIVGGSYETTTRELRGRCHPFTLLFHPRGTTHDDHFVDRVGTCLMIALPRSLPNVENRSIAIDDAEMGFLGTRMLKEMRDPDRFSLLALEGLALEMTSRVTVRQERLKGAPPWLERARQHIHDHATDPARVADIAEAAGVHAVHLARAFRTRFDLSPGEYLRRVRVRKAMHRLSSAKHPLAAVALHAGFSDQSELTKAFRREIGVTPSAYRRSVCSLINRNIS